MCSVNKAFTLRSFGTSQSEAVSRRREAMADKCGSSFRQRRISLGLTVGYNAVVVQLVERLVANEKVAGSNPVCRSTDATDTTHIRIVIHHP